MSEHRPRPDFGGYVKTSLHDAQARAIASASLPSSRYDYSGRASTAVPGNISSGADHASSFVRGNIQRVAPAVSHTGAVYNPTSMAELAIYKPTILHRQHPDSKIGYAFHWVPYPLGLMPYDSWYHLHHRDNIQPSLPFRCPVCRQERKATAHIRKLFLIAERLTWEEGLVSTHEKDLNEELNWKCNYDLGILDPFVEDQELVQGGKNSRTNIFHPYQNEHELKLALKFMFMAAELTETSWALWIGMQLDLEKTHTGHEAAEAVPFPPRPLPEVRRGNLALSDTSAFKMIDLTESADCASQFVPELHGLPTPCSSSEPVHKSEKNAPSSGSSKHHTLTSNSMFGTPLVDSPTSSNHSQRIISYKTLQDFYSLLDRIERTSYVGALFLEAYAEKLRDDTCQNCWFNHNVRLDIF